MFKQFLSAILIASSLVGSSIAAARPQFTKTIRPFRAELVNFDTHLPFSEVVARLDIAVNKTGCAHFLTDFHNSKTKAEQVDLIAGIIGPRNFLMFEQTDHKAWMDVYDNTVDHPGALVYTLGNPNFAAQILPLEWTTGVNIPPRFLVLEIPGKGTKILYQQFSKIFAPFNHNKELAGHTHDLDVNFAALFTGVLSQ